jgi:hypothetical protein
MRYCSSSSPFFLVTPSQGRQKGKAKERLKDEQPTRTKKKKKKTNPSHGGKLFHPWPL